MRHINVNMAGVSASLSKLGAIGGQGGSDYVCVAILGMVLFLIQGKLKLYSKL